MYLKILNTKIFDHHIQTILEYMTPFYYVSYKDNTMYVYYPSLYYLLINIDLCNNNELFDISLVELIVPVKREYFRRFRGECLLVILDEYIEITELETQLKKKIDLYTFGEAGGKYVYIIQLREEVIYKDIKFKGLFGVLDFRDYLDFLIDNNNS